MNYCGQCGASVERIIPAGDTKPRDVCSRCGHIHYENPRIIAGCLPVFEDKVLLCQRAIEPRRGKWTLPAGFLENAETIQEGAARKRWRKLTLAFIVLNSIPSSACLISRRSICSIEQNSPTSTFLQARKVWRLGSTGKATFPGMNSPSLWSLTLSNAISLIGMLGSSHFERGLSSHCSALRTEPIPSRLNLRPLS